MTTHDDGRLDQVLRDFREGLACDDAGRQRMHDRLFQRLADDQPQPSRRRPWTRAAFALALCASVLVALVWFNRPGDIIEIAIDDNPTMPPPELMTFTNDEIRQHETFVCELDRVFEKQVRFVHHHHHKLEFDLGEESLANEETPRVLLRFVLQRQTVDTNWETVQTQELIGGDDHQFSLPADAGFNIRYWSHLLPDDSLWAEFAVSTGSSEGQPRRRKIHAIANQPQSIWTHANDSGTWRLWVVYELLSPCNGDLI